MHEKIVEIVLLVFDELRRTQKSIGEIDIAPLEEKGYTLSEISSAFSWLFDRISLGWVLDKPAGDRTESFRVLDQIERIAITPEAFGYLIQLRELAIITGEELEVIIDRAVMGGPDRLDGASVHSLVASVLFDPEGRTPPERGMIVQGDTTVH